MKLFILWGVLMFSISKFIQRVTEYGRGYFFKLYIILLGGQCGSRNKIASGVYWKYPPHKGIKIGNCVDIGPCTYFDVPPGASLVIGDHVKLTCGAVISAANSVNIGSSTLIAEYTSIRDSEHRFKADNEIKSQGLKLGSISIAEDVWIGRNASIFSNSDIRRGVVIGAGSMCKNATYEVNGVYVGTPALKLKERS